MEDYLLQIKTATDYIRKRTSYKPEVGLVLGSGLGILANHIEAADFFPYEDIPHFPISTVEGHTGTLVVGKLSGKIVLAMQGRIHYYEGYSMKQITFPIRVMQMMGIKQIIVTNACGGLNPDLHLGAMVFIKDHINMMGDNPLIGKNYDELGPRFPDMSNAYDEKLIALGQKVASRLGINTFTGVHSAVSGPCFESLAEVKMVQILGADTVGMSTIPEVIVAVHGGMKSLGISCVTDMAGHEEGGVSHKKVMEAAERMRPDFIRLVRGILEEM